MENTSRSIFSIHGLTGMLIAVVLLLSILVVLTYFGVVTQQSVANKPYVIKDSNQIKMIDTESHTFKSIKGE